MVGAVAYVAIAPTATPWLNDTFNARNTANAATRLRGGAAREPEETRDGFGGVVVPLREPTHVTLLLLVQIAGRQRVAHQPVIGFEAAAPHVAEACSRGSAVL